VAGEQPVIAARVAFYEAARDHFPEGNKRALFLSTRGTTPDKAIEILKNLLTLDRKNGETRRRLAVAYLLNYDPDNAEKVLLEAEFHHPHDKETHYLLGRCYVAMRRYDDALAFFGQVWSRDPAHEETLLFLAELNANQRRYRNAIGYLREALALRPDDPVVLFKLGLYSLKAGQRFNALSHLRQARATHPPASVREPLHELLKDYQ
jgi:tetratricopeptide (TPR) repeat protein